MATHQEAIAISPGLLRRLGRENREMGVRLAQLEYHNMIAELENPQVFELSIDFPDAPAPDLVPPLLSEQPISDRMPVLNVTLGKTAWVRVPEDLPVIGIFVPAADHETLKRAFIKLVTEHYMAPFARFVFLCEELRPVPLLGRYRFTYEHLASTKPHDAARRLNLRFGVVQIRHIVTGALLWRVPKPR
jgi:hypothetical protein